jgi:DeoR family transcriptional regulator of aga operon
MLVTGGNVTRAQRLAGLLERLVSEGSIDVERSAAHFGVSTATIRRDLDHLAEQQLLSRTHGGAVPNSISYDLPLRYKTTSRAEAKTLIARRAAAMLWPGCTVSLNGGTTSMEIARAIAADERLRSGVTVVTNALNIATELAVRPFVKIVVCGGVVRSQTYELVGALASQTLSQLNPDVCFLAATGVDHRWGVTTNDEAEAAVDRTMMLQARRTVVAVDSNKLGAVGFSRICHLHEVSAVLTDAGASADVVDLLRQRCDEVIVAAPQDVATHG